MSTSTRCPHASSLVRLLRPALGAVGLGLAIGLAHAAAPAAPGAAVRPTPEQMQQMQAQRHERMRQQRMDDIQMRLDFLAKKLQLTSAQQSAWQGFSTAVLALPGPHTPPGPDADAASLARLHASHLAARAQHAAQVADATEKLQATLGAEQKRTFNEAAHRLMARGMGGRHGGMGHGGHGGMGYGGMGHGGMAGPGGMGHGMGPGPMGAPRN